MKRIYIKFSLTSRFVLKQLDYLPLISIHDSALVNTIEITSSLSTSGSEINFFLREPIGD